MSKFNMINIESIPIPDIKLISDSDKLDIIIELYFKNKNSMSNEFQKDEYIYEHMIELLKSYSHFESKFTMYHFLGYKYKNESDSYFRRMKYTEVHFYSFLLMIESIDGLKKLVYKLYDYGSGSSYDEEKWNDYWTISSVLDKLLKEFNNNKEQLMSLINNNVSKKTNFDDHFIKKFKTNKNNSIKILKYEFTGGNDLDFNPLNGESLNDNDEYVGVNPTNQITFEVNGEKLYSKFIRIWDGPVTHGDYLFLSEDKEFEKIDIFSNHDMIFQNLIDPNTIVESMENLPYVISEISILMTDEDFIEEYDEIGYIDYEPKELNVEIDYVKMINDYNSF